MIDRSQIPDRRDDARRAAYASPPTRVKAAGHKRLTHADLDALVTSFNLVVFDTQAADAAVKASCDALVSTLETAPVAAMEAIAILVAEALRGMNTKNAERNERLCAHDSRLGALERGDLVARVAALEEGDYGVWDATKSYPKGASVTHQGAVYKAQRVTRATPTESSGDWRLAVRRGKQGRDGRDASAEMIRQVVLATLRDEGLLR